MHYLEAELRTQIATNPSMWDFLQKGTLDGCWYWDLENRDNEWMSPEFWRLFGYDPAERKHSPSEWSGIIFPDDLALAIENLEKHLADPAHPFDQTVRYHHADGSTVWVRCRGIAVRDDTGKPVRMLGAHNDVTALKQAEEIALLDRQSERAASEELRAFAYSVSHDLKSPANSLLMLLGEIDRAPGAQFDEDTRALLGMCNSTVMRMRTLIEDLLNYTRLIEFEPRRIEDVDLNKVLSDVQGNLSGDIKATGATLVCDDMPMVQGAQVPLRTLFQNLIENALKYRRDDVVPRIAVTRTAGDDGRVGIEVSDNGIGIDPRYHDRVFQMFKRLHTEDEIAGSGLGLALCRRIALNYGSGISLRSQPGEGSTFCLSLQCKEFQT